MVSPTTSTCEPYRQSGQKRCRKFYARKPAKKERRTRVHAKTAEVGCVMGAGEDGNGWGRIKPDEKTRCPNQNAPDDHATRAKRKPAKTQCFRRFCGRGRRTCLACWLGQLAAERHWRSLAPRHAVLEWMWESAAGSGEGLGVTRFPPQAPERPVLVWCCELFLEKDCASTTTSSFERKAPPPGGWPS